MASRASDDERARANATLEEERARVAELREKLRGAVKKGKTIEKEREALAKLLEDARRASGASAREDAEATGGNEKALETKVAVLRAELESFKAENEALREKLDAAEASSDESDDESDDGSDGSDREDSGGSIGREGKSRKTSKAARMRLRIAKAVEENEKLTLALNDLRSETANATAAANAEKLAAEAAKRAAVEERELAASARAQAESEHVASVHARAEAEARVTTLEAELEKLSEENRAANGRLAHLTEAFAAKQEEYEGKIAAVTQSAQGESTVDRADVKRIETELAQARHALREAQDEIDRLKSSDATESALAARASESVWKERAQAAMAQASAAREAYETQMNNLRADGGASSETSTAADVLAAEQRAKEAESALEETRRELAALAAERARDSSASSPANASLASLSRRLAESEALVLKKNEEIDSLTRRFTDLAWRSTMEKRGAVTGVATPTVANAVVGAETLTPLAYKRPLNRRLESVLRHRRFIIGSYLVLLHLIAYEYLFVGN